MNKILIMGRLTADPELRQTSTGKSNCRFNVAVNRPKTQNGTQQADFISCVAWNQTAETITKYFHKGKPIIVEGSLRNNNYTDRDGIQRFSVDIWVDKFQFTLSDNPQQPQNYQQPIPSQPVQQNNTNSEEIINDVDIPF